MYKLVTVPNDILVTPSKPITVFNKHLERIVREMEETLIAQVDPQGVGLAAPQVGLDITLFIMKPTPKSKTTVCVNPVILEMSKAHAPKVEDEDDEEHEKPLEGCLSIPKIWAPVVRPKRVHLEYQKLDGSKTTEWFTGFKAVIVQHEVDHLNGILFTRRALEQEAQLYVEKGGKLVPHKI